MTRSPTMTALAPARRLALSLLLLGGCADYSLSDANTGDYEVGADDTDGGPQSYLRLDVLPSPDLVDGEGAPLALPQTFQKFVGDTTPTDLLLASPVAVTGTVTAWQVSPWADVSLPGVSIAVHGASVALRRPDSIQSANTVTDPDETHADAAFSLLVPPDAQYHLAVVPTDPLVPFLSESVAVTEPLDLPIDLGYGVAVFGQILDDQGRPVVHAAVHAVATDGTAGAEAQTDNGGWYELRVQPGSYTIVDEGRGTGREPVLSEELTVGADGAELPFTYLDLGLVALSARVTDPDGHGLVGGIVRFHAESLDGYPEGGASFDADVPTTETGNVDTRLLAGTYTVELLPPDAAGLSARSLGEVHVTGDFVDLGTSALDDLVDVSGTVVDPMGSPVAGAVVTATEAGFGERSWQATTDDAGGFTLGVPTTAITWTIAPPAERGDVALTREDVDDPSADVAPTLQLAEGVVVEGTVRYADADGKERAAAGSIVEARDDKGRQWGVALADQEGAFSMRIAWAP